MGGNCKPIIICFILDKIFSKIWIVYFVKFPIKKYRLELLQIPKSHYEKIQDMPNEVSADLFSTVHKIIPKIDKISGATLLAIHNGKESGQEIPHVHVHLIPRRSDDLAGPVHSMFKNKPKLSDEELDELCAKIKNS